MRIRGRAEKGVVDVGKAYLGLNAEVKDLIHDGLKVLAGYDWDGATIQNNMGFNKQDTNTGNYLASCEPPLTQDEAERGWIIIRKYHRQIPEIIEQIKGEMSNE